MGDFLRDLVHVLAECNVPIAVLAANHRSEWATAGNTDKDPWRVRVPSYGAMLYPPISPAFLSAFRKWPTAFARIFCMRICPTRAPSGRRPSRRP